MHLQLNNHNLYVFQPRKNESLFNLYKRVIKSPRLISAAILIVFNVTKVNERHNQSCTGVGCLEVLALVAILGWTHCNDKKNYDVIIKSTMHD